VVAERVFDSPDQPTVGFGGRRDLRCAGGDGVLDHRARIVHDQEHPHGASAECLGAEVLVRRGLVGHPEGRVSDGEVRDHVLVLVRPADPVQLDRAESRLVELDRCTAPPHRQLGRDAGLHLVA